MSRIRLEALEPRLLCAAALAGDLQRDGTVNDTDLSLLLSDFDRWGDRTLSLALANWGARAGTLIDDVLQVVGTDGDDLIHIEDTHGLTRVQRNGQSALYEGLAGVVVRAGDGDDVIDILSALPTTVYTQGGNDTVTGGSIVVTIGGGTDVVRSAGVVWADATDTVEDARRLHRVEAFYQPWADKPIPLELLGQDLPDPQPRWSSHHYANFAGAPLFVDGPQYNDVIQGYLGDCYFMVSLAAMAQDGPGWLTDHMVDLGDGTFAVAFYRDGVEQVVRVDADLVASTKTGKLLYARPSATGELWPAILEKAWASFRDPNAPTYAAIENGWMSEPVLALTNQYTRSWFLRSTMTDTQVLSTVEAMLAEGLAMVGSRSTVQGAILPNHGYQVLSITEPDALGRQWIEVYNPWGYDGADADGYSDDPDDGHVFVLPSTFLESFSTGTSLDRTLLA